LEENRKKIDNATNLMTFLVPLLKHKACPSKGFSSSQSLLAVVSDAAADDDDDDDGKVHLSTFSYKIVTFIFSNK